MSLNLPPRGPVDDWQVVRQCLPHGWEGAAYAHRAIERSRRIRDPAMLLRVLLVHLADHGSLQETCVRSAQAGWGALTKAALFKRLQAAAPWLAWMSARLWRTAPPTAAGGRRLRAVDATAVTGPGESGGVWRVHYAINLASLHGDWCELTDAAGGETLRRVPVRPGDVLLGDRTYGTPRGLPSVLTQDADVLVRGTRHHLPLFTPQGPRLDVLSRLRTLAVGQVGAWPAWVRHQTWSGAGRLIAVRRGQQATERIHRRLRRWASRQQQPLSSAAVESAGYVLVWSSLPESADGAIELLERYRLRWPIELAFQRLKSIVRLGALPKHVRARVQAWLQGQRFVALLLERLLREAEAFSPWGYPRLLPPEPMA